MDAGFGSWLFVMSVGASALAGMLGMADRCSDLSELLDGVANLLIEDATIGHDDHGVEDLAGAVCEPYELVRQPSD